MEHKLVNNEWAQYNKEHVKAIQSKFREYSDKNELNPDAKFLYTSWGNKVLAQHFLDLLKMLQFANADKLNQLRDEFLTKANLTLFQWEFLTIEGYEQLCEHEKTIYCSLSIKDKNAICYGD